MYRIALFIIVNIVATAASVAQEDSQSNGASAADSPAQSYVVQFTEFRLKSSSDPKLSASEIVKSFEQMRDDGKVELVEVVRLSTLAGYESMVQFGKMASVTVGTTAALPGRGPTRQLQRQSVGTLVRVTAEPQEGKVLLKLAYEASRFEGAGQEDSPPDTVTVQFNTTLLIETGKPTLVGGTSADATTFLLVSIDDKS